MTGSRLSVACLGAGYFSQFHNDGWRRIGEADLIGSADLDLEKAKATGLPAFPSLTALLQHGVPDILDIILKPPAHLEAITQAIEAGVKTIICQKPFCTSLDQARTAIARAAAAGVSLIVHENFRFQPWYRYIATAIGDGMIGTVHQLSFRLRPGDGQGPDAYLDRQPYFREMPRLLIHETGVHFIDTFCFLLGTPRSVYADLRRLNPAIAGEDAGLFIFDYADGRRALFDGNRLLDHDAENHRLTMGDALIEGDRGALSLTGDGAVHFRAFGGRHAETVFPAQAWPGFGGDCARALQAHVVSALLHGTPLENQAGDYLRVLALEDAIYRSAEEQSVQEVGSFA